MQPLPDLAVASDPGLECPEGTRLANIVSPGFEIGYPVLRNAGLIPPEIMSAMRPAWSRGAVAAQTVEVFGLADVVVAEQGLVLDRSGRPYRRSIAQHGPQSLADARHAIAAAPDLARLAGRHVLCVKPGATNYGHWLIEMLPKAWLAEHVLGLRDVGYFVHDVAEPLRRVMLESLALLGIGPERVRFQDRAPVGVEQLVLIDGLTEHGGYMSPLVVQCLDRLARPVIPAGPLRLFVSRADMGSRSFANDAEIERAAQAEGWSVVRPGGLKLAQQIALFRGATAIAGVMGAALANIGFALPGKPVVVFAPATMPDTFFWFLAGLRGLRYSEVRCPQLPDRPGLLNRDQKLMMAGPELRAILRDCG